MLLFLPTTWEELQNRDDVIFCRGEGNALYLGWVSAVRDMKKRIEDSESNEFFIEDIDLENLYRIQYVGFDRLHKLSFERKDEIMKQVSVQALNYSELRKKIKDLYHG